jgi:hypothetical protein
MAEESLTTTTASKSQDMINNQIQDAEEDWIDEEDLINQEKEVIEQLSNLKFEDEFEDEFEKEEGSQASEANSDNYVTDDEFEVEQQN